MTTINALVLISNNRYIYLKLNWKPFCFVNQKFVLFIYACSIQREKTHAHIENVFVKRNIFELINGTLFWRTSIKFKNVLIYLRSFLARLILILTVGLSTVSWWRNLLKMTANKCHFKIIVLLFAFR